MAALESFPNAGLIWTPQQLKERLGDENLVILDMRPSHEIMTGIIPGAAHFDLYGVHLAQTTAELMREYINMMRSQMGLRGVGMDRTVVAYESESGIRAARAFWLLEYFGHNDVHVLDGGIKAWKAAGFETTQEMNAPKPHSLPITPREDIFISADDLHTKLGDENLAVLDTRADDEWLGTNTRGGPRGGTIPGGIHLEWTNYLDSEGKFKPAAELAALFESAGITRDKAIVPF
jgi:thiosulfate/3-mercaptopyruvate sulfurtransferase